MADLIRAYIEKIAAGGAGFARIGGKSAFIEGCAVSETVVCRVTAEHRSWVEAQLLEIVEPSPERVLPACAFAGKCGGCNLQHLSYAAQAAAKTAILEETFARIGGFCPPPPVGASCEQWGYRNRMQFHVIMERKKGALDAVWGLKARKKDEIVPVCDCLIADAGIRSLLRSEDRKAQAQLDWARLLPPNKDRFTIYARGGLLLSEGGISRGKTQVLDRPLALDAGVFFQSNGAMLERLILDLREIVNGMADHVDRTLPMADIYCGVGTFAAFLGELFPHIDLIEENKTALAIARENLTGHKSTAFFAQRGEVWAKNGFTRRYGFVIADPPRQGLEPALVHRLAAECPPMLAYVSCDPATLARDSKILLAGGYELAQLRWYDFYPQTAHIESLAVFVRRRIKHGEAV